MIHSGSATTASYLQAIVKNSDNSYSLKLACNASSLSSATKVYSVTYDSNGTAKTLKQIWSEDGYIINTNAPTNSSSFGLNFRDNNTSSVRLSTHKINPSILSSFNGGLNGYSTKAYYQQAGTTGQITPWAFINNTGSSLYVAMTCLVTAPAASYLSSFGTIFRVAYEASGNKTTAAFKNIDGSNYYVATLQNYISNGTCFYWPGVNCNKPTPSNPVVVRKIYVGIST